MPTVITQAAKGGEPKFILYSNLICPFAQRAHIAALEKGVSFTYSNVPLSGEIKKDPSLSKSAHFLEKVKPFVCFCRCIPRKKTQVRLH
jgi:hypothetical protein